MDQRQFIVNAAFKVLKEREYPLSLSDIRLLVQLPPPRIGYAELERAMLLNGFPQIFARDGRRRYRVTEEALGMDLEVRRSQCEIDFEHRLRALGLPVVHSYRLPNSRYVYDLALIKPDGRKLDVEVDGERWHLDETGQRREHDIRRDKFSESQGWEVMRFWYTDLRRDMDSCARRVQEWWRQ